MKLRALDHVNLRTAALDSMRRFYTDVLGLNDGARPAFDFDGAWLYAGDRACVHLVAIASNAEPGDDLRLSHFAFRATGFAELIQRLQRWGIAYRLSKPPGLSQVQVHLHDPDGNQLHIDFEGEADS